MTRPPPSSAIHSAFLALLGISRILAASLLTALASPAPAVHAQESTGGATSSLQATPEGWNTPRVLELVQLARGARGRSGPAGDLQTYRARTEGHIYFFLDPESGERPLIRIDQVAVDVRWQAPDRFQQHIVGHRSEVRLPVRDFDYYLDRLTLVRHGFGDEIRIGSGLDVADVPHPFAPDRSGGVEAPRYDFRLADSLTLSLPGRQDPVRIYEIQVRPTNPDRPGVLGSIHIDRASGSVVRMDLTFTAASYTDSRNDRVSVYLDYGLWENRYWLPNLQRIEVRREIPELDIGLGTVIRSVLRVRDYELNVPLLEDLNTVPTVTAAPQQARRTFAFDEGLYDAMDRDGMERIRVGVDPMELRAEAYERLRAAPPSGLSPFRFHIPALSHAVRFNRVEGLRLGTGATFRPSPETTVRLRTGYGFADERLQAGGTLESFLTPDWQATLELDVRALGDLGLTAGTAPLLSSLSAATRGRDYRDPHWISGGGLRLKRIVGEDASVSAGFGMERHVSGTAHVEHAPLDDSRRFRGVRPIRDGEFFRGHLGLRTAVRWPGGGQGRADLQTELLHGQPGSGMSLGAALDGRWGSASGARRIEAAVRAWSWIGRGLPQGHRLLGGRGTVPGFAYRSFAGRQAIAGSLAASTDLWGPLVRARVALHGGWSGALDPEVADAWQVRETGGLIGSVSAGLGLGWDLLRLDLARGLGGGQWQLLLSVDPAWWDRL